MYRSDAPDELPLVTAALKAVAEPTRLRILKSLDAGELCVGKIVSLVGLSQPTVSKHLAILRAAGLVTERKDGRWSHYRTSAETRGFRARLLALLDTFGAEDATIQRDWRRAEELRRDRGPSLRTPGPSPGWSSDTASSRRPSSRSER